MQMRHETFLHYEIIHRDLQLSFQARLHVAYLRFIGDDFNDHLYSEDGGEDHVQDVHDMTEFL